MSEQQADQSPYTNGEPEHNTSGPWCWCAPYRRVEINQDGEPVEIIIHRDIAQIVRDAKIKDAIDTADLPTIEEVTTGIQSELLDLRRRCGYSFNSGAHNDAVAAAIDSATHAIMSVRATIKAAELMDGDTAE